MNDSEIRVIAIEARRSRFGYALFEGPQRLIDWGANTTHSRSTVQSALEIAHERVSEVLRRSRPVTVVVNRQRRKESSKSSSSGPVFNAITREVAMLGVALDFVTREEVGNVFATRNRDDIAERLAAIFPELLTRLPRRKKKWQPERRGMAVFDAVSLGMAYWKRAARKNESVASGAFPPAPHELA